MASFQAILLRRRGKGLGAPEPRSLARLRGQCGAGCWGLFAVQRVLAARADVHAMVLSAPLFVVPPVFRPSAYRGPLAVALFTLPLAVGFEGLLTCPLALQRCLPASSVLLAARSRRWQLRARGNTPKPDAAGGSGARGSAAQRAL